MPRAKHFWSLQNWHRFRFTLWSTRHRHPAARGIAWQPSTAGHATIFNVATTRQRITGLCDTRKCEQCLPLEVKMKFQHYVTCGNCCASKRCQIVATVVACAQLWTYAYLFPTQICARGAETLLHTTNLDTVNVSIIKYVTPEWTGSCLRTLLKQF